MFERCPTCLYTGDGKGKTTAALGRCLDAVSRGSKVYMVQFLKRPNTAGEHFTPESLSGLFTIVPAGIGQFIVRRQSGPEDREVAQTALKQAYDAMLSGDYGMVILDEAMAALRKQVIDLTQILDFISAKPENVELVITGRKAPPDVISLADIVIEMKKVKHHFDKGLRAIKGIDY